VPRLSESCQYFSLALLAAMVTLGASVVIQAAGVEGEQVTTDNIVSGHVSNGNGSNKIPTTEILRDPTQPINYRQGKKAAIAPLTLQAIIQRNGKSQAVINGVVVGVGSRLDSATIIAIEAKTVTYERGGQIGSLRLRPSVVIKR